MTEEEKAVDQAEVTYFKDRVLSNLEEVKADGEIGGDIESGIAALELRLAQVE